MLPCVEEGSIPAEKSTHHTNALLGQQRDVPLALGADGLWHARIEGLSARAVGLEVWRMDTNPSGVSPRSCSLPEGEANVTFGIRQGADDAALRTSLPITLREMRDHQRGISILATFGWCSPRH